MKQRKSDLRYLKFIEDTIEMELIINDINARKDLNCYGRLYNYFERRKFLVKLKLVKMKIKKLEKEKNKTLVRKKSN